MPSTAQIDRMQRDWSPLVIVGAPRTGTNLLRDLLTQLPGYGTWPCDEINYIWRHGNATHPNDEFGRELARPGVKRFIRRAFGRIASAEGARTVVEKTCANSLRIGFVDEILPEAKFVFLVRDGRDVVASSIERWRAPLEFRYLYKKAKYVPVSDLPYYAFRYVSSRFFKLFSSEKRLATWGPRFDGMEEFLQTRTLAEICAHQWKRCTEKAEAELAEIDTARVHRVKYEDIIRQPARELEKTARFLNVALSENQADHLTARVRNTSVGRWRQALDAETLKRLEPIWGSALERNGYV